MSASGSPTGATPTSTSTSATASASEIVPMIRLSSMSVRDLKGLYLGEESLHLGLHHGVGLIGGCEFGCVLDGGGCAFILVNFEARLHLIYDGVGVVESQFVNCSSGFPEFKVSFLEVVIEILPSVVRRIGAFPHPYVVFEYLLSVEDNEGEVYCLTLG